MSENTAWVAVAGFVAAIIISFIFSIVYYEVATTKAAVAQGLCQTTAPGYSGYVWGKCPNN